MSLPAMVAVFARSEATLGARLVMLALAEFAHDDGGNAFPSVPTIAARTKLSDRQVQRALRQLEDAGEIERQGQTSKGVAVWRLTLIHRGDNMTPGGDKSDGAQSGDKLTPDPSNRQLKESGDIPEERARRWLTQHPEVTNPGALDYILEEHGVPPERRGALLAERKEHAA